MASSAGEPALTFRSGTFKMAVAGGATDGVGVFVAVGGAEVGVEVGVAVGVGDGVSVAVAVGVAVGVGVLVGVEVGVGDGVFVGVEIGVDVAVSTGMGVNVGVGVGVLVGLGGRGGLASGLTLQTRVTTPSASTVTAQSCDCAVASWGKRSTSRIKKIKTKLIAMTILSIEGAFLQCVVDVRPRSDEHKSSIL